MFLVTSVGTTLQLQMSTFNPEGDGTHVVQHKVSHD